MATILKNDRLNASGESTSIVAFNVDDVYARAEAYIAEVRNQARQVLNEATQQADEIRKEAYKQGQEQARQDIARLVEEKALQLSDQRCRSATAACQQSIEQLAAETSNWLQQWRNTTIGLAQAMAERLVRHSMKDQSEVLRVWMEQGLTMMRETRELRILVHPDDFAVAGRFLQQMSKQVPQAAQAEVIPDPSIELGGCIVKSSHGQIDQQLSSQLTRLAEQLQ